MSTITAERLGIGNEIKELKFGKSFKKLSASSSSSSAGSMSHENGGGGGGEAYHTIRYDFKPASVDKSKIASIEFGDNNKVSVTAPNVEGSGQSHTVFKGSRKPHIKECVLVIDHETGEITLERLSQNIAVKKTRAEKNLAPKMQQVVNNQNEQSKKTSPSMPQFHTQSMSISPKDVSNHSPNHNKHSKSSIGQLKNSIFQQPPAAISSQSIIPPTAQVSSIIKSDDVVMNNALSESSSDSDSSNSSSSSEDENEEKDVPQAVNSLPVPTAAVLSQSESSDSSDSASGEDDDDEDDDDDEKPEISNVKATANGSSMPSMPKMLSMPSMPKFNLLSEDLQLSETGSDSD